MEKTNIQDVSIDEQKPDEQEPSKEPSTEERLFTQEDVNRIVRERLARERQKAQPEQVEDTASKTIEDVEKEAETLPEEIRGEYGVRITDPEDIKLFCKHFDPNDSVAVGYFKEMKDYAAYYDKEFEFVDEEELDRFRNEQYEEKIKTGKIIPLSDGGSLDSDTRKEKAFDGLMRKIFGLPEKERN